MLALAVGLPVPALCARIQDQERPVQRTTLVATMRNEGPYLVEWIAYHRLIGFTEIVVCTNGCADGSPELLDALQKRGILRHIRCHPAQHDKAQLYAYRQVEALLSRRWPDVLMVLDADEYLNIHVGGGTVPELLAAVPGATAVMVNWRIFGSSGHQRWSAEPVTRRYCHAAARDHGVNRSFKTLFTQPEAYHCPLLPHGPGFAKPEHLSGCHPVDGSGAPLPPRYARAEEFLQTDPGAVTWQLAQVNHYNTRSWQDYLAKHDRGGGLGPERWDRDSNWAAFNRNEESDLSIQRHRPAVELAMAEILSESITSDCYQRCLDLYGRHVEALVERAS
jgi:hypothetical protein